MKIAQVAPLFESVPPRYYGGTERIVSYLTEELVRQGHDVTLYASGDSCTSARLVPSCREAIRLNPAGRDPLALNTLLVEELCRAATDFDIIHLHVDYLPFPALRRTRAVTINTLHGRLDIPDLAPVYRMFAEQPLVSISNSQRAPMPWANWVATVYHGIPLDLYTLHPARGRYLAFIGRISPEKRCDRAIEIATRAGMEIKIAAKIDPVDDAYAKASIKPLLNKPHVEYLGEIGEREKNDFLGNAYALLFPVDWPEPFGLTMIEALACGTPVIAWRCGSVPEIIDDGATGYIVNDIDGAVAAVKRIEALDRTECRRACEQRYSVAHMAKAYLRAYHQVIESRQLPIERVS
jgi:glycosyltransferase involved in cell wall biosynthesis